MIYTFRSRRELIDNLRALCDLSCGVEHSSLPKRDFDFDLPALLEDLALLKRLYKKYSNTSKIYIAFRTTGFESSTNFYHFKSRVTALQTSVIACYHIQFEDGYYILQQISLN